MRPATDKERILKSSLQEAYDEILISDDVPEQIIMDATYGTQGKKMHISTFIKQLFEHRIKSDKIRIAGNKELPANAFWDEENRRKSIIKKWLIDNIKDESNLRPDM